MKQTFIVFFFSSLVFLCHSQKGKFTSIQKALLNKDSVEVLVLSEITESLPAEISEMKNLKTVRLINLEATYNLSDAFIKLSKNPAIETLELWDNKHTLIPKEIQYIKSLKRIGLNTNSSINLEYTFESLSYLPLLNDLDFGSMDFERIPLNIVKLKNLKKLNFGYNSIVDIDHLLSTIGSLEIEELNLKSTNIHYMPSSIKNLKFLKRLDLDDNTEMDLVHLCSVLSGTQLEILSLGSLELNSIPEEIAKLTSVKRLELEMMRGDFNNKKSYKHLAKMPNLRELDIQGNFFLKMNKGVAVLNHLEKLEVDGNCLSDEEYKKLCNLLPNVDVQNIIVC